MSTGLKVAGFIEEHIDHSVCYVIPTFTPDGHFYKYLVYM